MNARVVRFYEAISSDESLQDGLWSVVDGLPLAGASQEEIRRAMAEAVAAFATEHDFDLTADDLLAARASEGQLDDVELELVSGGRSGFACYLIGAINGSVCFIFGGEGGSSRLCAVLGMDLPR